MQLLPGAITLADLQKFQGSARNPGIINIPAGQTTLASLDCGTVNVGDLVLLNVACIGGKGGVAGITRIKGLQLAGTAVTYFLDNMTGSTQGWVVGAGDVAEFIYTCVCRISTSGTLTLGVAGTSAGSDLNVQAMNAQIYVWIFRTGG